MLQVLNVDHTRGEIVPANRAGQQKGTKHRSVHEKLFGSARLQPSLRIGRGGRYYHLVQLMKFLNLWLAIV